MASEADLSARPVSGNLLTMVYAMRSISRTHELTLRDKEHLLGSYLLKAFEGYYHFGYVWKSHDVGDDIHFLVVFGDGCYQAIPSKEVLDLLWPAEFVPEDDVKACAEYLPYYTGNFVDTVKNCPHCPQRKIFL